MCPAAEAARRRTAEAARGGTPRRRTAEAARRRTAEAARRRTPRGRTAEAARRRCAKTASVGGSSWRGAVARGGTAEASRRRGIGRRRRPEAAAERRRLCGCGRPETTTERRRRRLGTARRREAGRRSAERVAGRRTSAGAGRIADHGTSQWIDARGRTERRSGRLRRSSGTRGGRRYTNDRSLHGGRTRSRGARRPGTGSSSLTDGLGSHRRVHHQHGALELRGSRAFQVETTLGAGGRRFRILRPTIRAEQATPPSAHRKRVTAPVVGDGHTSEGTFASSSAKGPCRANGLSRPRACQGNLYLRGSIGLRPPGPGDTERNGGGSPMTQASGRLRRRALLVRGSVRRPAFPGETLPVGN